MKQAFIAIICLVILTGSAFGQKGHVQSLTFNDLGMGGGTANSGTYQSTDTFSFDVLLTFSGYNAVGLSFWL
jgi:hypothetical protein